MQASLLSEPSSPTWPKQGTWDHGYAYELPTLALPTNESDGSSLLPTPAAQEPGGTPERHLERKNRIDGANRVTPTHLSLIVQLLPTPSAWLERRPENATPDPERQASRGHDGERGKRSLKLPDALALAGAWPTETTPIRTESTNQRSADGSNRQDDQHQAQLTIEDA